MSFSPFARITWLGIVSLSTFWCSMSGRRLCAEDGVFKGGILREILSTGPKTLGGPLLWTDYVVHGDWRIQKHVNLGHFRLLSPRQRRAAMGSLDTCYEELQRRRITGEIAPMPRHVVLVMHGLGGSRHHVQGLADYIEEHSQLTVISFGYASTKGTIQEQTVALESVIRNLQGTGVQEVSLVGFSMGNMLIRHMLYRFQVFGYPPELAFRRLVMISPPNHGARIAEGIGQSRLIQVLAGPSVDQFAPDKGWPALEQQLVIPDFEFGIIAGGRGNDRGYLRRIPGDDDGLISIQTHMLDGAADFIQTGGLHQLMPKYRRVKKATLNFLLQGHFR